MKRIIMCAIAGWLSIVLFNYAFAKKSPPVIGSVKTFVSENGLYSVDVKILNHRDRSPSECSFKERNNIIWTQEIPTTPGIVNISNDGKLIIAANWGWYDEGGFKSLSIYNNEGILLKEIIFEEKGRRDGMLWIEKAVITSDGKYHIFSYGREAELDLRDIKSNNLIWSTKK